MFPIIGVNLWNKQTMNISAYTSSDIYGILKYIVKDTLELSYAVFCNVEIL